MAKIGLIQVDGPMPNLALLKLASWHKAKGDEVTMIDLSTHVFDRVYGSKIFMGGSGYDLSATLPDEVEAVVPDYDAFKLDHSIGFSSRGCIRDCGFCIVREKEGPFSERDLNWIKNSKVLLLDNNFFASCLWRQKLEHFISHKIKVCFTQGLDIRLITSEKAEYLAKVRYYDADFRVRRLYFAFDSPDIESTITKNVFILTEAGILPGHLMFYVLIGFNTTFEEDMRRVLYLDSLGCLPFVMLYNRVKTPKLRKFARWVNRRYYKVVKWEDFK